jgi:hypothetical protein
MDQTFPPPNRKPVIMSSQYHYIATDKPVDEVMVDAPANAGQPTGSGTTSSSEGIEESVLQNLDVSMLE